MGSGGGRSNWDPPVSFQFLGGFCVAFPVDRLRFLGGGESSEGEDGI
jgi:hypothetical protein